MVQIIPAAQPKRTFASRLNEGLERGLSTANKLMSRHNENEALVKRGIDLRNVEDPETRAQLLSHDLQYNRKKNLADVSRNTNLRPERSSQYNPGFSEQNNSMAPQQKSNDRRILSFDEQWDEADRIATQRTESGIPTTTEEILPLLHARNEENKSFAAQQEQYGNQAVESLYRNVSSDVTNPDLEAKFRKYGEEAAENSLSQSEFHKNLAEKVKNFKNALVNIEKLPGPRLLSQIGRKLTGKYKTKEEQDNAVRTTIKPLLDEGENDIVRTKLSKLGYGPEEIESHITTLPEMANKHLANMPKIEIPKKKQNIYEKRYSPFLAEKPPEYNQAQRQAISNTVDRIFKDDPSVNLLLLRKAMGEKNVDWRLFKETVDNGILNGSLVLNPSQLNQMRYIDEPPLDDLEKILHGLNLIGK